MRRALALGVVIFSVSLAHAGDDCDPPLNPPVVEPTLLPGFPFFYTACVCLEPSATPVDRVELSVDSPCGLRVEFFPPFQGPIDVTNGAFVCFDEAITFLDGSPVPPNCAIECTVGAYADSVRVGTQQIRAALMVSAVCDPGGPYVVECVGPSTPIQLDGTGSFSPCGRDIRFDWKTDCKDAFFDDFHSPTPILTVPTSPGCLTECNVYLILTDGVSPPANCIEPITIRDTTPPRCVNPSVTGGDVDTACRYTVPFSATFTDNCGILESSVSVGVALVSGAATLESPHFTTTQISPTEVALSGTVRVSGVRQCPARVRVTFDATDRCGHTAAPVVVDADVRDATPPTITTFPSDQSITCPGDLPPPDTSLLVAMDGCGAPVTIAHMSTMGNSGAGCASDPRIFLRVYRATDACGNFVERTQRFTMIDTIAPTITGFPPDQSLQCAGDAPAPNVALVTATDNCGGVVTITHEHTTADSGSGCTDGPRVVSRVYRAMDACGNFVERTQRFTVTDTTHPIFTTFPADRELQCHADLPPPDVTLLAGTDNCGGTPAFIHVETTDNGGAGCATSPLVYSRVYRATDTCGNATERTQRFTIVDVTPPTIGNFPPDAALACGSALPEPDVGLISATDNCGVAPTVSHVGTSSNGGIGCAASPLVYSRVYRVTDACGNFVERTQRFSVTDATSPVITNFPEDQSFACAEQVPAPDTGLVSASDDCGVPVAITHVATTGDSGSGCNGNPRVFSRVYRATDACGNFVERTQRLTVLNSASPTITGFPPDQVLQCSAELPPPSPALVTAIDGCGGSTTVTHVGTTDDGGTGCAGNPRVYLRTYRATDACGNFVELAQRFTVADTTNPTILNFPADVSLQCEGALPPPNSTLVTASDNCAGAVTITHVHTTDNGGEGCTASPLVFSRVYRASDACGNFTERTQRLTVIDSTPPQVTDCIAVAAAVPATCAYTLSFSAQLSDNCALIADGVDVSTAVTAGCATVGDPQFELVPINETEAQVLGTVTVMGLTCCTARVRITFDVMDACGRTAVGNCEATVSDTTAPALTGPADVMIDCGDPSGPEYTGYPDVSDNCDDNPTLTYEDEPAAGGCENGVSMHVLRTWRAVDDCANAQMYVQTITSMDSLPPQISACSFEGDGALDAGCDRTLTFSATASDNCCLRAADVTVEITGVSGSATIAPPIVTREQVNEMTVILTGTVRITDLVGCAATVRLTVNARDCCGNDAPVCTTEQTIADVTPPVFHPPSNLVVARGDCICDLTIQEWLNGVTATDNCSSSVTITYAAPPCPYPDGSDTVVTWTATDRCGNSSQSSAVLSIRPGAQSGGSEKGSLLIYSTVELKWNSAGELIQDTFISLLNDYEAPVAVQMYFVNGDPPLAAASGERAHRGWNTVDNLIYLTQNQPVYWSAATGQPEGVSPFTVLDPGNPPGRPDPENPGQRYLRGFIVAFAVNAQDHEIRWNDLSGHALILNYANTASFEYQPWAFQVICGARGAEPLDCTLRNGQGKCIASEAIPGRLDLDGFQYDLAPSQLIMEFFASGATPLADAGTGVVLDTDLTLHPISVDLRNDHVVPIKTKANFYIWNQNEVRFSEAARCITCWDQTLLSRYGNPIHFLRTNLQTDRGYARIDGISGAPCAGSVAAAMLGVSMRVFDFSDTGGDLEYSGSALVGLGTQSALIQFTPIGGGGESHEPQKQIPADGNLSP